MKLYKELYKKYGHNIKALNWGSKKSQERRFEILTKNINLNNQSILDVGCGFGDFYAFLVKKFHGFIYTGIDVTEEMVNTCKKKYPHLDIRRVDVKEMSTKKKFDYVFASGILYTMTKKQARQAIKKMFALTKKSLAFNALSIFADYKEKNETYLDPIEIFKFCQKLSSFVILDHSYMKHDFTIHIYINEQKTFS